ncbi:MAG: hypothetical protein LKE52_02525 [Bacilli bacterium]|jgi:hypothetical protein|nr:hypothetical protein [Bacilli bacterium]
MNPVTEKKLEGYFGFAKKMPRGLLVGMRLEEGLSKGKVSLLILTSTSSDRNKEHLQNLSAGRKNILILDYKGEFNLSLAAGYEKVSALGIRDPHLGKAIYDILSGKEEETKASEGGGVNE